jgi:exosortase D (VPLPA-CTERM-specific)
MFGARVAEGFFHGFSGWLIFMFAIPFLLFEMWVLRNLPPRAKRSDTQSSMLEVKKSDDEAGNCESAISDNVIRSGRKDVPASDLKLSTSGNVLKSFLQPTFIVSALVLLLTFMLSQGVNFRQRIPVLKSFSQFPVRIGEWQGEREEIEQQFLDVLKFSDYTMVNYKNPQGKMINFYVAYYQDQQKGESIHSPETCLPAGGWEFNEAGITVIRLAGGKTLSIARAFIEKGGEKQLIYYWFPMRGRVLTKLYQLKIYTFWDSLTKQRTDGALVRIITPVGNGEKLSDAETRLQRFIGQIVPVLDEYIPK